MPAKSSLLRVCRCFWKVCVARYFVQGCHSPRPSWYCQHLSLMLRSLALRKPDWSVLMPFFPSVQHKNVFSNSFFRTKSKLSKLFSSRGCLCLLLAMVFDCPFNLFSPTVRDALEHAREFETSANLSQSQTGSMKKTWNGIVICVDQIQIIP